MNLFQLHPRLSKSIFAILLIAIVVFSWTVRIAGLGWGLLIYGIPMLLLTLVHIVVHLRAISKIPLGSPWVLALSNLFFFISLAFQYDGSDSETSTGIAIFKFIGIARPYETGMIGDVARWLETYDTSILLVMLAYVLLFVTWFALLHGARKHNTVGTETPPASGNRVAAITVGAVLLILLICVASFFIYIFINSPGPQLGTDVEYPDTVRVGERFEITLSLTTAGLFGASIKDIRFEPFEGWDFILEGAKVIKTDPDMESRELPEMQRAYSYDRVTKPGETQTVTFYLVAVKAGEFNAYLLVDEASGASYASQVRINITP